MSMHKVHFINGTTEIFFDVSASTLDNDYRGYSDSACHKRVSIPKSSVLYVEVMH